MIFKKAPQAYTINDFKNIASEIRSETNKTETLIECFEFISDEIVSEQYQDIYNDTNRILNETLKLNNIDTDIMELINENIISLSTMTKDEMINVRENIINLVVHNHIENTAIDEYDKLSEQYKYELDVEYDKLMDLYESINIRYKNLHSHEREGLYDELVLEGKMDDIKETGKGFIDKIKEFFKNLSYIFSNKIKKVTERDKEWLENNKSKLLSANTKGIVINIYDDYEVTFQKNLNNIESMSRDFQKLDYTKPDEEFNKDFEEYEKSLQDEEGKLKEGIINKIRTGKSKGKTSVATIKDDDVKVAVKLMISYCESFMGSYSKIKTEHDKGVKFFEKAIKEADRIKENYAVDIDNYSNFIYESAMIEKSLYTLLENEGNEEKKEEKPAEDNKQDEKKDDKKEESNDKSDQKEAKVGVVKKNEELEFASQHKGHLTNCKKMWGLLNTMLTAELTALEAKYFDYIKILRGVIKGDNTAKKEEKKEKKKQGDGK